MKKDTIDKVVEIFGSQMADDGDGVKSMTLDLFRKNYSTFFPQHWVWCMRIAMKNKDEIAKSLMNEAFSLFSDELKLHTATQALSEEKPIIAHAKHNFECAAKVERKKTARLGGRAKADGNEKLQKAKGEIKTIWLKERESIIASRGKAAFCKNMQEKYRTHCKDENGKDTYKDLIKDVKTIQSWIKKWDEEML